MPKAGIHGRRSTNWKFADVPSNQIQSAAVTANATSEMPSVIQRTRPSRRPSALPMNSRSSAPASGTSQERVNMCLAPQVVPQNHHDADEHRAGIRAHRTGLQSPQDARSGGHQRAGPVHGAVNHAHVETAPEPFLRSDAD